MASLGFSDQINQYSKDLKSSEAIIGKSLKMPFTNTNAGAKAKN